MRLQGQDSRMLVAHDLGAESMQRITARRSCGVFNDDLELLGKTLHITSAHAQLMRVREILQCLDSGMRSRMERAIKTSPYVDDRVR